MAFAGCFIWASGSLHCLAQPATLKVLVGFPAGGGTDSLARLLSEKLKDSLGINVLVDNRAGAGGQIAAQVLKGSPADGSVLYFSHDHSISILPLVVKQPGYSPNTDFVAVAGVATFANGLALSPGTPAKTFNEYLSWVKEKQQGRSTIGVPAPASIPEFLAKVIADKTKLDIEPAAYRGSAPMMADMLGNQVPAGIAGVNDFMENIKAGKFKMVAVIGEKRQAALPEVPTFGELGMHGFEDLAYFGFFAPSGTPKSVIDRYSEALGKILSLPDVRERMQAMGLTPGHMNSLQFQQHVHNYTQNWARIVKNLGIQAQ
jgi:tripartite-type tricarboxylate transporter receptor subunit TctC